MKTYTKTIGVSGVQYTVEFDKIRHYENKVREVREDTVAKAFKDGKAKILVVFEETGKTMMLDDFSDQDLIRKYLGKTFLLKK